MKARFVFFRDLILSLILLVFVTSCTYDKTTLEVGSLFDPTWDFSDSSDVTFNKTYVEIKNGKAQLKALDFEQSGEEFGNGNHTGTVLFNEQITMKSDHYELDASWTPGWEKLVGYWKMNSDWSDSVGGATGSPVGDASFDSGHIGSGVGHFDGFVDRVDIPLSGNASLNRDSDFSVSAWFFSDRQHDSPVGSNLPIIQLTCFDGYVFKVTYGDGSHVTPGRLNFNRYEGSGPSVDTIVLGTVAIDQWNHFLITKSGSDISAYYNGVHIQTKATVVSESTVCNNLQLGLNNYKGMIDEVALWSRGLTASEASTIYNHQAQVFSFKNELSSYWAPQWDKIVGHWRMDGNWEDSSGNENHGSTTLNPQFSTDKKIGYFSGDFDGDSEKDRVDVPNSAELTNLTSLTFSTWAKFHDLAIDGTDNANLMDTLLAKGTRPAGANGDQEWNLFWDSRISNNRLNFVVVDSGSTPHSLVVANFGDSYQENRWYHIMGTWKPGEQKIFIDGKLVATNSSSAADLQSVPAEGFHMGSGVGSGTERPFDGELDDVAIWNVALSPSEITQIYQKQKQKYSAYYDSGVFSAGSLSSVWSEVSWLSPLPFGKELVADHDKDGTNDSESSSEYVDISPDLQEDLEFYFSLNEGSVNSVNGGTNDFQDHSKNNQAGDESGGVNLGEMGILNNAVGFDGVDDFISVADFSALNVGATMTTSIWVRGAAQNNRQFFSQYHGGAPNQRAWTMGCSASGSFDKLQINISDDGTYNGANVKSYDSSTVVCDNDWHHVAFTFNSGVLKLFVDGEEDTSVVKNIDGSITTIFDASTELLLGAMKDTGSETLFFAGLLDEAAIWSKALSPSEIQQLYRRGANRIKLQMKSCLDINCECESYSVTPLGSTTDCDGDGTANSLDSDDPRKAEFKGPGGNGTTFYSELFNRKSTDINFNCGTNTADGDSNICVNNEISFNASPAPTGPLISYDNFPLSARLASNPYFQYRVYIEAEENKACNGSPCLPELTNVNLNPNGIVKYHGALQEVKPTAPLAFSSLQSIKVDADSCTTYRLSPDGTNYYHYDSGSWVIATDDQHRASKEELESHIGKFSDQFSPGLLYISVFLQTNVTQTAPCGVRDIDVKFSAP